MKKSVTAIMLSSMVLPVVLSAAPNWQRAAYYSTPQTTTTNPAPTATTPNYNHEDDFAILANVQDAIKKAYKSYNINIRIMDGVVTLTGVVNTENDKNNIGRIVSNIQGVQKVNNQIEVSASTASPQQPTY